MKILPRLSVLLSLLIPGPGLALADRVAAPHVLAELVSDSLIVTPGTPFAVGLRFLIDDGWHTYWKNPGDSGTAPRIRWEIPETLSQALEPGELEFPTPHRIDIPPLTNYGYSREALQLVTFNWKAQGQKPGIANYRGPLVLRARADWLVCKEVCVPGRATLTLSLVVGDKSQPHPTWAPRFRRFRKEAPKVVEPSTLGLRVSLSPESPKMVRLELPFPSQSLSFFPLEQDRVIHSAPQKAQSGATGSSLEVSLTPEYAKAASQGPLRGVLVLERSTGTIEAYDLSLSIPSAGGMPGAWTWLRMLFFGFVGGILLNLMPCVFPVISIKILSFTQPHTRGGEPSGPQLGVAFSLGILLSFFVLGLLLFLARTYTSLSLGWGFQLQSPIVVMGLTFLFLLMALNLSGVFEVGETWMRMSGRISPSHHTWWGSFFSGILATAVAAPCTAPFMGAAMGYALQQPAWTGVWIFLAVGLGMSLPYGALSLRPDWLRVLPKPGRWMETLKQFLAFPLYATTAWLVWILIQQRGLGIFPEILSACLLTAIAAWIWGRLPGRGPAAIAGLLMALALGLGVRATRANDTHVSTSLASNFSDEKLQAARASGQHVFLEFTASWCVTCIANERLVIDTATVQNLFRERNIAVFKVDWTLYEPKITQMIQSFGREGVPLYVVYPRRGSPILLPEVITPGRIRAALDQAEIASASVSP